MVNDQAFAADECISAAVVAGLEEEVFPVFARRGFKVSLAFAYRLQRMLAGSHLNRFSQPQQFEVERVEIRGSAAFVIAVAFVHQGEFPPHCT